MKSGKLLVAIIILGSLVLAECSVSPTAQPVPTATSPERATAAAMAPAVGSNPGSPSADLRRDDAQGAVEVSVTPENLSQPGDQLVFDVGMNTHSVDLSMNVAGLATLLTDTGKSVRAQKWDAPRGGHHVSGKLIFPTDVDGASLLAGARQLTLVIKDIDAPERKFTWNLNP